MKTNSWREVDTTGEEQMFSPTFAASTTIVHATTGVDFKCCVYVIGGWDDKYEMHKKVMEIEVED